MTVTIEKWPYYGETSGEMLNENELIRSFVRCKKYRYFGRKISLLLQLNLRNLFYNTEP